MDLGYSYEQVTGPIVNAEKYPSVNQGSNIGGSSPGFVARFYDEKGRLVQTSVTVSTVEELDPIINRTLKQYA